MGKRQVFYIKTSTMQFYDEFMLFVVFSILIVFCSYLKYLLTRARLQFAFTHQGRYWLPPIGSTQRPETDIEAQNEINSEARAKPPDYFEDLPPTYEEAMKMKNLEASTSKVIFV